ncbi:hypothetical protein EVAR_900_1 [Eumeta japonica]|uniref:Uncharacterized protein n=1 Tax=Eumeta variegata TaxID=151549 RepID=A0A4C1SG12_EUMVA|nr:hypothetical protein EVAR_900_1 [Eumeta japonica]
MKDRCRNIDVGEWSGLQEVERQRVTGGGGRVRQGEGRGTVGEREREVRSVCEDSISHFSRASYYGFRMHTALRLNQATARQSASVLLKPTALTNVRDTNAIADGSPSLRLDRSPRRTNRSLGKFAIFTIENTASPQPTRVGRFVGAFE